ncbi:MAG: InlB B-repeat-containing protein [Wujia sp.]
MKKHYALRRALAVLLVGIMAFTQITTIPAQAGGTTYTDEEIVSPKIADSDVILSVTGGSAVALSDLMNELSFDSSGKINVGTTNIDTADLSSWYVYDHYDTRAYANETVWEQQTGYDKTLRPYYAYTENNAYQIPSGGYTTIPALKGTSLWCKAMPLNEHINATQTAMTFYGYGYGYGANTDFLFYPAAAGGTKKVSYTVDARNGNTHSMVDAGFLINCSTEGGVLNGYAMMFVYTGTDTALTGISKVNLYKLTNVNVNSLHNSNYTVTNTSDSGVSLIKSVTPSITYSGYYDISNISLTITDTSLYATMQPAGSSASSNASPYVLFNLNNLTSTGKGGFGPIVGYGTHSCSSTSCYMYSNLKMSITTTSSVLDGYINADFVQKKDSAGNASDKYYVLIGDPSSDSFSLASDKNFLELIKKENVILITNLDINASGTSDYNLETYLGTGNVYQVSGTSAATLARAIENVVNNNTYDSGTGGSSTSAVSGNVAIPNAYITYKGYQVGTINTNKVPAGGITLTINTDNSINTAGKSATYTLQKPDGTSVSITGDTFVVESSWPAGTYTLNMTYGGTEKSVSSFNVQPCVNGYFNGLFDDNGTDDDHLSITMGTSGNNTIKMGMDFVSTLIPDSGYTYPASVCVYVDTDNNGIFADAEKLSAGTGYTYDKSTGKVVVKTASITGNVNIVADTEKVQYELTGVTTTGYGAYSTYENAYTTTFSRQSGVTPVKAEITVGEGDTKEKYVVYTDEGSAEDGKITFNGTTLTIDHSLMRGPVKIAVDTSKIAVVTELTNLESTNTAEEITYGTGYTTTIKTPSLAYKLPQTITVKVGNNILSSSNYSYNPATGAVTVSSSYITGRLTIIAEGVINSFDVINQISHISMVGPEKSIGGQNYEATLTPDPGYSLPESVVLTMNGEELTAGTEYTYSKERGFLVINGESIEGDIYVTGSPIANDYAVSTDITDLTYTGVTGADAATAGVDYRGTLTDNAQYSLPENITVTVGGKILAEGDSYAYDEETDTVTGYTYDPESGAFTVFGDAIIDDIEITAAGVTNIFAVDKHYSNVSFDGPAQAGADENYIAYVEADRGYSLPDAITVKVGDTTLAAGKGYSYIKSMGCIIINQDKIVDDITIEVYGVGNTYGVTYNLSDVTTNGADTVTAGVDYSAVLEARAGYTLPDGITVKVGGIELTDGYEYNQSDGTLTIDGSRLIDEVDIEAAATRDTYTVDKNGLFTTIEGANEANVDTAYTAEITAKAGYTLPDAILVEVGGIALTSGDDYSYDAAQGTLDIPAGKITGNVVIRIESTPNTYNVTKTAKNAVLTGADTATAGMDYTATAAADPGYSLPESIVITAGDKQLVQDTDYTYSSETGELVIDESQIINDIVIAVTATANDYPVTRTCTASSIDGAAYATAGINYDATLIPAPGYSLPDSIQVLIGDTVLEMGTAYTYNNQTGFIVLNGEQIIDDVEIIAAGSANTYSVTKQGTYVSYTGGNTATAGQDYEATVAVDAWHALPDNITITVDGNALVQDEDYLYSSVTGEITIYGTEIIGDVVIRIDGDEVQCNVVQNLRAITLDGDDKAVAGNNYEATLVARAGYTLPDTITVKIGTDILRAGNGYTYNARTGYLVINGDRIVEDIMLDAAAIGNTCAVTKNAANADITGGDTMVVGTDYTATIAPATGYHLPDEITVKNGTETLTADTDYTYSSETGELVISGDSVTDYVTIEVTGVADTYSVTKNGTNVVISGADNADIETAYHADITAEAGYSLPAEIVIRVGGNALAANRDYAYDSDTGSIDIAAGVIIGNVVIEAAGTANTYVVSRNIRNVTMSGATTATAGLDYETTVAAKPGYGLPENITVMVGDKTLEAGTEYTYSAETGEIVIDKAQIIGDVDITISGVPVVYAVSADVMKLTFEGETTATVEANYEAILKPNPGYSLPDEIEVKINGVVVTEGVEYSYMKETGDIAVNSRTLVGDIEITARGVANTYPVSSVLDNMTTTGADKATVDINYRAILKADAGYSLPETIKVTVDGRELTDGQDYSYNGRTGVVSINGSEIIGAVVITADAILNTYAVTVEAHKDGAVWEDSDKVYSLVDSENETVVADMTKVSMGTYDIYEGAGETARDTGVDVTVTDSAVNAVVDYYTVTFYDGDVAYGDDTPQHAQIILKGDKAVAPATPAKAGYSFTGWMTQAAGGEEYDFTAVAVDTATDLYAGWSINTYAVTVETHKDGAVWEDSDKVYSLVDSENETVVADMTKVSMGTYDIYEGAGETARDTGVDVTVTDSAVNAVVDYYTVTFYDGDVAYGDDTPQHAQIILKGDKAVAPATPAKAGYSFTGWMTQAAGGEEYDFTAVAVDTATDLYAGWNAAHVHVYNYQIIGDRYLKSEATCESAAVYYRSCACGQSCKGTDREILFTYGKPLPHKYTYTATGNIIIESCANGCGHNATATITASDAKYTAQEITNAQVVYSDDWKGGILDIVYSNNVKPGTGIAQIGIKGVVAQTTFKISAADDSGQTGNDIANRNDLCLLLTTGVSKGNKITLNWLEYKGATGYEVYWSYCNKTNYTLLKATKRLTMTHTIPDTKKSYKYYVVAYKKINGKKVYLSKSTYIHVAMPGDARTNIAAIQVEQPSVLLSTGARYTIKSSYTKENENKPALQHVAEKRYYSDNKAVATVNKNGVIVARQPGTCNVYVVANNGVYAKIEVVVE